MDYISAKTIISQYAKVNPWFGINYNMNIYKGCCHGCIYCDSRSQCYGIDNFDKVRAKENAIQLIRKELQSKRRTGIVGTGAMSDPYNPFEKELMLTRSALEQINAYSFGLAVATKSNLITRDIDILKKIKVHSPIIIKMTITTIDDVLCEKIEPNVCVSSERFRAIQKLTQNGIFSGILLMPILPFINDNEENIVGIVRKASQCGAKFIYAYGMGVTLRQNQRDYFYNELRKQFQDKNLAKQYNTTFGDSYECSSLNSEKLLRVFKDECETLGILYKMQDIVSAYKSDYKSGQISWF